MSLSTGSGLVVVRYTWPLAWDARKGPRRPLLGGGLETSWRQSRRPRLARLLLPVNLEVEGAFPW